MLFPQNLLTGSIKAAQDGLNDAQKELVKDLLVAMFIDVSRLKNEHSAHQVGYRIALEELAIYLTNQEQQNGNNVG
jgi:hypothetical protein